MIQNLVRITDKIINLNFVEFATRKQGVSIYQPEKGERFSASASLQEKEPERCHNGSLIIIWMNGASVEENPYHFYDEEGELIWKYLFDNSESLIS